MKVITKARVRMNGDIEWIKEDKEPLTISQVQDITRRLTRFIFTISNLNLQNEK